MSRFAFANLSIIVNLARQLNLWSLFWKCLSISITFGHFTSFFWLFNWMVSHFYWHIVDCIKCTLWDKCHILFYSLHCKISSKFCWIVGFWRMLWFSLVCNIYFHFLCCMTCIFLLLEASNLFLTLSFSIHCIPIILWG